MKILAIAVAILLGGCVSLPNGDRRLVALTRCQETEQDWQHFLNLTYEMALLGCMERAGWVQRPVWNPYAVERYLPR
jgi:hypothetical protein